MDNRNMSSNSNNSMSHSVNEIGDQFNLLNVNEPQQFRNGSSSSSISSSYNGMSIQPSITSRRDASQIPVTTSSKLNPGAQEFIPRNIVSVYNNASSSHINNSHVSTTTHMTNGCNNIPSPIMQESESYTEDYISLSYLKEFINHISNKPSMYELGIYDLTIIMNSFLDEDECVPELIVNQIVDQSIIDVNFRYNGVRLCHHFMENLRQSNSGQTFKTILFKRNQRECSRSLTDNTSVNTFIHLQGLALFTAELYSRCKAPELAEHLPNLLINILSKINSNENIKCVCQVLKLCGQQLELYFNSKNRDDVKKIFDRLKESLNTDIPSHIKSMVTNVIELSKNRWIEPKSVNSTSQPNPYLNNNQNSGHVDYTGPLYPNNSYYFGDCGDESNSEICQDFENFLKSLPQDQ